MARLSESSDVNLSNGFFLSFLLLSSILWSWLQLLSFVIVTMAVGMVGATWHWKLIGQSVGREFIWLKCEARLAQWVLIFRADSRRWKLLANEISLLSILKDNISWHNKSHLQSMIFVDFKEDWCVQLCMWWWCRRMNSEGCFSDLEKCSGKWKMQKAYQNFNGFPMNFSNFHLKAWGG